MRRDLFMGKLNPEKFSQRLQDLNKYLDYIPIERTTLSEKIINAYGKSFPEDEIRSIMGRAIPPEWTVNLLSMRYLRFRMCYVILVRLRVSPIWEDLLKASSGKNIHDRSNH
jgi:hypothetical protein